MTCRETETLDLAAFLAGGSAPEFAAFRAHYPRCAECAAEVRAWTELHAALAASSHPSSETLLRYEDRRLADADRGTVARHLEACAACRDELRALGAFDRETARAARPAAHEPRRWFRLPEWGRLVMHPALAYGLVLALLFYPSLRRREPAPPEGRRDVAPAQKTDERTNFYYEFSPPAREERAAPAEQPAADASERMLRQERAPAAPPAAAGARAKADAGARESDAPPLAALAKMKRSDGAAVALVLRRDLPARLDARTAGDWVTLRLPTDPSARSVEVRVLDQGAERRLSERRQPADGWVEIEVPTAWLSAGRYVVEVHPVGGEARVDAFPFEVDR